MSLFELDKLTWEDIDRLDRDKTIFFLPISPIEEHGPHLPTGTDFYAASDIAKLAAEMINRTDSSINCVIIPGIPVGCSELTMEFPGTISVRGETLASLVYDICSSLARHEFKFVAISNHHLDLMHVKAISEGIKKVTAGYDIKVFENASLVVHSGYAEDKTFDIPDVDMSKEIHADIKETSFIKFRYPELLRECYSKLPQVDVDIGKMTMEGKCHLKEMGAENGYIGTPAKATKEIGESHLETGAELLAELSLKLIHGEDLPELNPQIQYVLDNHIKMD